MSLKYLNTFHEITKINLDEFMEKCSKFQYDWIYNYYCSNITCLMEASRLMEDILGYMQRRIDNKDDSKSYKAPKMVIDSGHDFTVAPIKCSYMKLLNLILSLI